MHQFVHDASLVERGLRNYWGYNSIGFFAPHNDYAVRVRRGEQVQEFKAMVRTLHDAGIEVILDVVYNHTAEGNHLGPDAVVQGHRQPPPTTGSSPDDPRHYFDTTGTGNSLNVRHPRSLQLIMDSLRYWVTEMHVDGFRFDLAATLARQFHEVDRLSAFFDLIEQDPVVSQVKLIAEPWDVGEGGYQVGNFPPVWSEWNGQYRDTVPRLLAGRAGDPGRAGVAAHRQLRPLPGRRPPPVRQHQLRHRPRRLHPGRPRLLQREAQRGQRRGQPRRRERTTAPGTAASRARPTIPTCCALPRRQQRNFLATLLLSQGVPMLLGGDEIGRTQRGNNNAYCQDNEISWFDWDALDDTLLAFTRELIALRREHPVFRRRRWFQGRPLRGTATSPGSGPTARR